MVAFNEVQRKWVAEFLAKDAPAGTANILGGNVATAKASPEGKTAFVPDLEISSAPKLILAVNESVTLKLKIRNWAQLPKGTGIDWRVSTKGQTVNLELNSKDGDGWIKVTGLAPGESTVRSEVRIGSGSAHGYRFADTVFVVKGVAPLTSPASPFVPELEMPSVSKQVLALKETVTMKLKIRNWAALPKGTKVVWDAGIKSGDAVDVSVFGKEGEGTVQVSARFPGEAMVRSEVRIGESNPRSYRFTDMGFVVNGATSDPKISDQGGVDNEGGPADARTLESDMRMVLNEWQIGALQGANQFATQALNDRINDLASGSASSFLNGLLGNTIWAGAAFMTGGGAFAISMVGIAVAAAPTVPSTVNEQFIPQIQAAMDTHIELVHGQLVERLGGYAQALLKAYPGISRYRAMAVFLRASFAPGLISINDNNTTAPHLKEDHITIAYQAKAERELEKQLAADAKAKKAAKEKKEWEDTLRQSRRHPGEV